MSRLEVTEEEKAEVDKWLSKTQKAKEEPSAEVSAPKSEEVKPVSNEKKEKEVYRCRGKDCGFQTLDLGDFIQHTINERLHPIEERLGKLSPPKAEEPSWAEEKPPLKRHVTPADHLDCPDCYPKFEAELLKRGWKKPEEKPATTAKKEGLAV